MTSEDDDQPAAATVPAREVPLELTIDSSRGINVLIRACNLVDNRAGALRLSRLPEHARRVLEVAGLHQLVVAPEASTDGGVSWSGEGNGS
jgi:hypothetical protein